jgi:flagellar biosynthetic protein FliR
MEMIPFTMDQVPFFVLILVRITTVIALLPIFGSPQIPNQLKIGFSILLTIILFSSVMSLKPELPGNFSITLFFLLVLKEVMVGLVIGFTSNFLFTAIQFAGRLIDTEIGFGFAEIADPFTEEPITVLGQFQILIFTIIFLLFNGHYFFILTIQKSFEILPLFSAHLPGGKEAFHITTMIGDIFVISLRFAAPIYVTLILTEMALAVIARTVPQLNIFFVGMPLKIVVGLISMIIVLPSLTNLFKKMFELLIQDIWRLLYLMA